MRKTYLLADIALNDSLNTDILVKEPKYMKVKTTFYSRSKGVDYDPVIHVSYPKSRADQLSYSPTSKLAAFKCFSYIWLLSMMCVCVWISLWSFFLSFTELLRCVN